MRIRTRTCTWCVAVTLIVGSVPVMGQAVPDAGRGLEASVIAGQVVPRPLGRDLPVYHPVDPDPRGRSSLRPVEDPVGQITLRDALALALVQGPELATYAWELRAREARILQAERPPNPVVTALVQDLGGPPGLTGAEDPVQTQTTIELSQVLELGGKRAARRALAAASRDLAAWDYEAARIDVLTRVTKAYLDVLASQETVTLAEQTMRVTDQVQQTVGLRVAAGTVSPIEKTKADVASAVVRLESARARRALDADRLRLATLWGSTSARFQSALGSLTTVTPMPTFEALVEQLDHNPELARWVAEVTHREAALAVERAKRVPDLAVIAGYRRYSQVDSNALVVGASFQLPLFDRNRGATLEAQRQVNKAAEEQRAAGTRVTATLAEAYRALSSANDDQLILGTEVLPGARSVFEAVGEGYRLGRFAYLDVLDAQRTLVNAGGQYLRSLAEFHKAATDVERLVGVPLSAIAASAPTAGTK
jgi:cobalt-zinc-cadmium efflux system outer membrane protein